MDHVDGEGQSRVAIDLLGNGYPNLDVTDT